MLRQRFHPAARGDEEFLRFNYIYERIRIQIYLCSNIFIARRLCHCYRWCRLLSMRIIAEAIESCGLTFGSPSRLKFAMFSSCPSGKYNFIIIVTCTSRHNHGRKACMQVSCSRRSQKCEKLQVKFTQNHISSVT